MQQLLRFPAGAAGFRPVLRGYGSAVRAAQSIGIEWLDHARLSGEEIAAATERLMAAPTPMDVLAVQMDCLRAISERVFARATTCAGLLAALAADLSGHGSGASGLDGGPPPAPTRIQ